MKKILKLFIAIAVLAGTFTSCDSVIDITRAGRTIEDVIERIPSRDGEDGSDVGHWEKGLFKE